jgi:nucleoside-diphosphate-sugar epimerase
MTSPKRVLVTGAGGFIGHHLVTFLKSQGHWVRGVDLKPPEYEPTDADQFELLDLRRVRLMMSMPWLLIWVAWASFRPIMPRSCTITR